MWSPLNALAASALAAAVAISPNATCPAGADEASIESLVLRARVALQPNGQAARGTVEILGESQLVELPASFRLVLGDGGRFLRQVDGRLSRTTGVDGQQAWRIDGASPPCPLVLLHRERARHRCPLRSRMAIECEPAPLRRRPC